MTRHVMTLEAYPGMIALSSTPLLPQLSGAGKHPQTTAYHLYIYHGILVLAPG